jgi:hypothetical protein
MDEKKSISENPVAKNVDQEALPLFKEPYRQSQASAPIRTAEALMGLDLENLQDT